MTSNKATTRIYKMVFSVTRFILLATVLGGVFLCLVAHGYLPKGFALMSTLSASTAGILMTLLEDGVSGLKQTWRQLRLWRVDIQYWFFAAIFISPVFLLSSLFNPLFGGDPMALQSIQLRYSFLPMFIVFFIVAGLGQEIGWSGYLLPRIQVHFNALVSSILRAVLIGFWHLPLFFFSWQGYNGVDDFPYGAWITDLGFLAALGIFFLLFMIPWSIFSSWIYNNTKGSLLLVAVLHGSEIWVAYWMMEARISPKRIDNYLSYGLVLLVVAVLITLRNGQVDLSRKYRRIRYHSKVD